ncbi:MAG TPA: cation diffusion facilitator family transporter [Dehalococcoidales bacterium]
MESKDNSLTVKKTAVNELNREKSRMAYLSVISNTVLLISKIIVGLAIGSVSVISEGIHSGIDLVAAVIAFFAVRQSSKPPDRDHYYGHGKFENISGAVEALLILLAAVLIIRQAYVKLVNGVELESVNLGIIVMIVSVAANYYISRRLLKTAKRTESVALEADAWHLRTDVITSLGILAGLVIIRFSGWKILDPIMAILVALFIVRTAVLLTWKSVRDLIDVRLPASEENTIKSIIQKYSGSYFDFHEMRTRKAGSDRFIDFHLVVCKDANIEDAHSLADKMEQEILQEFPRASIIIHMEPCQDQQQCETCEKTPGK